MAETDETSKQRFNTPQGPLRRIGCALSMCQTFSQQSDDDGVWGECSRCGKVVGFVSRAKLRDYADAEHARRTASTSLTH